MKVAMQTYVPEKTKYGLLVDRTPVRLGAVDGQIELFGSANQVFREPLIITNSDQYTFEGVTSGRRAVLVNVMGTVYKIKGCSIEEALKSDGHYNLTRHDEAPLGGEILSDARNELQSTEVIGEVLAREGFLFPYTSQELFIYNKKWLMDDEVPSVIRDLHNLCRQHSYLNGIGLSAAPKPIQLAASVVKIIGDTRLPEIYLQPEESNSAVSDVSYRFGLIAGAQKKVTQDYYWGRSGAHLGNYVVFLDGDQVHMSMVDFEVTRHKSELTIGEKIRHNLWQPKQIPLSVWFAGLNFRKQREEPWVPSPLFRDGFRRGFKDGFKNSDKREPIHIDDLCQAYSLEIS